MKKVKNLQAVWKFRVVVGVSVLAMGCWVNAQRQTVDKTDLPLTEQVREGDSGSCGNGVIEDFENCKNCSKDVGLCLATEGDGELQSRENCKNAPQDAMDHGMLCLCGNGAKNTNETCENCPGDMQGECVDGAGMGVSFSSVLNLSVRFQEDASELLKADEAKDPNTVNAQMLTANDWNTLVKLLNSLGVDGTLDILGLFETAVPDGAIMAFALDKCPEGWTEYGAADGRFLMGTTSVHKDRGDTGGGGNDGDAINNQSKIVANQLPQHYHYMFTKAQTGIDNESNEPYLLNRNDKRFVALASNYRNNPEYHMATHETKVGYYGDKEQGVRAGLTSKALLNEWGNDINSQDVFNFTNAYVKVLYCVKGTAGKVDGVCDENSEFGCLRGSPDEKVRGTYASTWKCKGIEGGAEVQCKKCMPGYSYKGKGASKMCYVDGKCGSTRGSCRGGVWSQGWSKLGGHGFDPQNAFTWVCDGVGESGTDPSSQLCWQCDFTNMNASSLYYFVGGNDLGNCQQSTSKGFIANNKCERYLGVWSRSFIKTTNGIKLQGTSSCEVPAGTVFDDSYSDVDLIINP